MAICLGLYDHADSRISNIASSLLYVKDQNLCRYKLTSAHHVGFVPDVFVDNASDCALRNFKISRYGLYGL